MLNVKGGDMPLSEKLYVLRKERGLSQEQLAEKLSVSRQAILKWESGQSVPESDKLLAISSYFDVSLDYLLKETEEQPALSADHQDDNSLPRGNRSRFPNLIILDSCLHSNGITAGFISVPY